MTNGFEEAKQRRNWLEELGEKIPGFSGFQDRELRREVDKMQREYVAGEFARLKGDVRSKAEIYTDAGQIGSLHLFDRLDRRLDGLAQAIRFSDYGATGLFDVVKIGEPELERIYEFDVSFLEEIGGLEAELASIPSPGEGDPAAALDQASSRLAALEEKWAGRSNVISGVIETAS